MSSLKRDAAKVGITTWIGGSGLVVLSNIWAVLVAMTGGLILSYLFPETFAAALALVGLGKFALWQVAGVTAYAARLVKLFQK